MITLYMVTYTNIEKPEDMRFFTISEKKVNCEQYILRKLMIENSQHFLPWCELRNLEPNINVWKQYVKAVDLDTSLYTIRRMKYTLKDLASIFRMYNNCVPLGCGYESKEEYSLFVHSLSKEEQDRLLKFLQKEDKK